VSDIRAITYLGAFAVSQSDTVADPKGPFAAIEATSGNGLAKVLCLDGSTPTVYLTQGLVKTLGVVRVFQSVTTGGLGIVGYTAPSGVLP
jgi:hypothetical protein